MINKKFTIVFFIFCNLYGLEAAEINVKPEHFEKMNLLLGLINPDEYLKNIAQRIKADFEFGEQFKVTIQEFDRPHAKQEIIELGQKGFSLAVFLNLINFKFKNRKGVEWRLYDTLQANMLNGKKTFQTKENDLSIAHSIADQIWPDLTGQSKCFCSTIVACKKIKIKKNQYHVYLNAIHPAEYINNLSSSKEVIKEQTICFGLSWNLKKPLLYYSKHTSLNVRLMSIDLSRKKSIVSNFDGLNMNPAFDDEGKIVLSLTNEGKGRICQYIFDDEQKKGKFVAITNKKIHAISPSFIDNENIVFCSIDRTNRPRIAIFNLKTKDTQYLTKSFEYCVCPVYNRNNKKIAYCKKINGFIQVFLYDIETKEHTQVTFNSGDKDCCSWSPCGNYIVFSIEQAKKNQIAILNILTQRIHFLTPEREHWSCPAWSPVYEEIPFY